MRAVDVQWEVTLLLLRTVIVEHHAVRAKLLGDLIVRARVVLVALAGVREETVRLRALALQLIGRLFILNGGRPMTGCRGRGRWSFPTTGGLAAQQSDVAQNNGDESYVHVVRAVCRPFDRE